MKTEVIFSCPACGKLRRQESDPIPGFDEMYYEMQLVCDCGVSSGKLTVGYSILKTTLSVVIGLSECARCGEEFPDEERAFLFTGLCAIQAA